MPAAKAGHSPSEANWPAIDFEATLIFSPSTPVDEGDLFAGRSTQIHKMLSAVTGRGRHVVLYGERGVGKTSLVRVFEGLFPQTLRHITVIREQADPTDDFSSLWRKVFKDIHIRVDRNGGNGTVDLASFHSDSIMPDDVRRELESIYGPNDLPIIVIDEFDKIGDPDTCELMANLIKALSDYAVNVTVVIVGVADDVSGLIGEHESIKRCISQVPMPRMSADESNEILEKRIPRLGMSITREAMREIVDLSRGLPSYVHALGLNATHSAVSRKSLQIGKSDVSHAIRSLLDDREYSSHNDYNIAVHSNRRDSLYKEVLLACALASTDDLGYFAPSAVTGPLTLILKKPVQISTFQRHLNEFITKNHGCVLQRKGRERTYRFRFTDPMMQPYVIMKGREQGLIED